jgi:hypothetical protein
MSLTPSPSKFIVSRERVDIEITYAQMAMSRALALFNRSRIPYGPTRDQIMEGFGSIAAQIANYWSSWTENEERLLTMALTAKNEARALVRKIHDAACDFGEDVGD